MDDEFDIHLFSNASSDLYYSNTLSSFTCELNTPVYFGENHNYSVALTSIYIPPAFSTLNADKSKDTILIRKYNYAEMLNVKDANFDDFINVILKMSACDVGLYDKPYFEEFLNDEIFFNINSIKNTSLYHDYYKIDSKDVSKFPLDISSLLLNSETEKDFLPPVEVDKVSEFFKSSTVKLNYNESYSLKQILFTCIFNILERMDFEKVTSTKIDTELIQKYKNFKEIYSAIKRYNIKMNILVHRFIEKFLKSVEKVRNEITSEMKLSMSPSQKQFIIVYADICKFSFLANTKAKVLGVFIVNSRGALERSSNFHFIPVEKTMIKNISIVLADANGEKLNLIPSSTPSYLCLKFKKMK